MDLKMPFEKEVYDILRIKGNMSDEEVREVLDDIAQVHYIQVAKIVIGVLEHKG